MNNDYLLNLIKENEELKRKLAEKKNNQYRRGDIVFVQMKEQNVDENSIMHYSRPHLIISNDVGNDCSQIVIAIPLTTKDKKITQPTHVRISYKDSVVLCEQIVTLAQKDLGHIMYHLNTNEMKEVEKAIKVSINIE